MRAEFSRWIRAHVVDPKISHALKVPVWQPLCMLADAAKSSMKLAWFLVRAAAESCGSAAFSAPWPMSRG